MLDIKTNPYKCKYLTSSSAYCTKYNKLCPYINVNKDYIPPYNCPYFIIKIK